MGGGGGSGSGASLRIKRKSRRGASLRIKRKSRRGAGRVAGRGASLRIKRKSSKSSKSRRMGGGVSGLDKPNNLYDYYPEHNLPAGPYAEAWKAEKERKQLR